ncbi:MAG: hypothetical protein IPM97_12480 [Bdellovibrionaceae bacterium]|nr:hypothetical protein [Pseudobdellovibrionaceae bacterium]
MKYIYHRKPNDLEGHIIFPLNQMEEKIPSVYAKEVQKYKGRESLMDEKIPILNCRWNDVVHFAPIDPKKVYQSLVALGFSPDEKDLWYKIPITKLSPIETVVFKYENDDGELTHSQVVNFSHTAFEQLPELPAATLEWYRSCAKEKHRPLLFHRVPHILSLNPIDISDCEVICWSDI